MSGLKIHGRPIGQLIRQTGDTLEQLDDGSWQGTVVYRCAWSSVVALAPRRNKASHPDFSVLVCTGCKITRLKPGLVCELAVTYRGFFAGDDPTDNSQEELISNTSEAPIETHPDFTGAIGGTKAAPLNGAVFDDDGKFTGWRSDSSYAGIESYVTPSTIYRYTYSSKVRPPSIVGVGTLSIHGGPGSPPGSGSGRDWLFVSYSFRREGGVYTVSAEHMLSGPRGWSTELYGS